MIKATLIVTYGVLAFACGVLSRTDRGDSGERAASVLFLVAVVVAGVLWRL
mgnify:CR=1 FL=1